MGFLWWGKGTRPPPPLRGGTPEYGWSTQSSILSPPPPPQWGWARERRAGWRFVGQWVGRALRRCRRLGELSVGRFPFPPFPLTRDGGSGCCWQKPAGSRFVLCKRMLMAGPAMR